MGEYNAITERCNLRGAALWQSGGGGGEALQWHQHGASRVLLRWTQHRRGAARIAAVQDHNSKHSCFVKRCSRRSLLTTPRRAPRVPLARRYIRKVSGPVVVAERMGGASMVRV
eukprot:365412-Chlamydomonas_euryale.AAC.13